MPPIVSGLPVRMSAARSQVPSADPSQRARWARPGPVTAAILIMTALGLALRLYQLSRERLLCSKALVLYRPIKVARDYSGHSDGGSAVRFTPVAASALMASSNGRFSGPCAIRVRFARSGSRAIPTGLVSAPSA